MQVIITNETLRRHRSCKAPYAADCPWWDEKQGALVYEDWNQSVIDHYLKVREGGPEMLEWLVRHKLVPMTIDEFNAAIAAARSS